MVIAASENSPPSLPRLEAEVVQFFVRLAQTLGLPRSVGEIYGIVFCSSEPVTLDEVAARLHISRGSASQGLRLLLKLGVLQSPYVTGDRRTFYVIEPSLRRAAENLVSQTVRPFLEESAQQLEAIRQLSRQQGPERDAVVGQRVESLQKWNRMATRLLPWLTRLMEREKWFRLR